MTTERPDTQSPEKPNRWIGPLILLLLILTPILILIVSNTDTATVAWAQFEWEAPRWLVLTATFLAGAVGGKVLGWVWRSWRRRVRRREQDAELARRRALEDTDD
ncbi:MAG TPA: lipopolysaccharide assembly protein LapA domain-containing protein [Acidimicrobiia bacterium]|nr:lipopolysaccharide assembly protein LapA domain-containing protein [Acidimicrobiia bacterium]